MLYFVILSSSDIKKHTEFTLTTTLTNHVKDVVIACFPPTGTQINPPALDSHQLDLTWVVFGEDVRPLLPAVRQAVGQADPLPGQQAVGA